MMPPVANAAMDSPSTIAPDSPLDGWGPYKFGMTADQVRSFAGPKWVMIPKPQWVQQSDSSFSLAASDEDQFGLHHVTVIEAFDAEQRLSSIHLSFTRGGLTPDGCKARFEGLLTQLEAQYGAFEPGDDNWTGPAVDYSKADITRKLPNGQSQYRDIVRENFQDPKYNPDTKILRATAKRLYGERSIAVQMDVVENSKPLADFPGQQIPANVLALAPNLANPSCLMNLDFQSKNRVLQTALPVPPSAPAPPPNSPPPANSGLTGQFQNVQSAIKAGAPPSKIASAVNGFLEAAKKDGLMGPMDPMLEAYISVRVAHDDEDEAALLAKMTPAQTAEAAYIRHDYPLTIKLWTPLAEKGNVEGAAEIASLYEYGVNGVTRDLAEAAKWRKLAASEGDGNSQAALGQDYAEGDGVPKDNIRAYMWLSVGLEQVSDGPSKTLFPAHVAKQRDAVAQQMSSAELTRAKTMITRCARSHYKACG
jgi:hypothetical protein